MTRVAPHDAAVITEPMVVSALGIDGRTGRPSVPAFGLDTIARIAAGCRPTATDASRGRGVLAAPRGLIPRVDPSDLGSAGWAAVFTHTADPSVRAALEPLLAHRRRQVAVGNANRFRILEGAEGYRAGDRAHHFLMRLGVGFGPVDPDQMPYYVLLVGGPEAIPFEVEHQLSIQYAVGRIAFDRVEDYAIYAESLIEAELGPVPVRPRRLGLFAAAHAGDRATETLGQRLFQPLIRQAGRRPNGWRLESHLGQSATKHRLCSWLRGPRPPAVLVTGGHGLSFACGDPHQRGRQGALICSDFVPPIGTESDAKPPAENCYVAARDIHRRADVLGLVAIHIACHSAGVPALDRFSHRDGRDRSAPRESASHRPSPRRRLSPKPFVTRLPQRLLAHPRGGAAAVIGHVDRVWSYGWVWAERGEHHQSFSAVVDRILAGDRIGHAMRFFGERYAELAAALAALVEVAEYDEPPSLEIARLWTASNDARGWVLLGDPAARAVAGGRT